MDAEGNKFENPFGFEETPKKIKLEDQSHEIQRLNQVIKDLKEELWESNSKHCKKYVKLFLDNEKKESQNDTTIKKLQKEISKLQMKNSKLEKMQTENDGIEVEAQNKAIISDLKSQNENVQFANEKLQYDKLMMRDANEKLRYENSMLTEKVAKLSKEKEQFETLIFANDAVIDDLKSKNLKLMKVSEKCKCKK